MANVQDIMNEIDRIEDAKMELAEAIGEKGVEVPQDAHLERYPEYVRAIEIPDTSECVKVTPQEWDEGQKTQARENIGAGTYSKPEGGIPESDLSEGVTEKLNATEIFWATYGTTTAAEIDAVVDAGKAVAVKVAFAAGTYEHILFLSQIASNASYYRFVAMDSGVEYYATLRKSNNVWAQQRIILQPSAERVTTLSNFISNRESTTKYPAVKPVVDALGKWGVVSQTQTWSGASGQPRTYVMSDLIYGLIPQANIDLFVSAGATFNETTGYFELNGLTDISYEEMRAIYAAGSLFLSPQYQNRYSGNREIRTILPVKSETAVTSLSSATATSMFWGDNYIEVVKFIALGTPILVDNVGYAFYNCYCLKKIEGLQLPSTITSQALGSAFGNCYSLEELVLNRLGKDLSLANSSLLNLASVVNIVNTAINTSAITITLHATAYARCQADTTEYEYNGTTYTGILAYASAKNINIVSA